MNASQSISLSMTPSIIFWLLAIKKANKIAFLIKQNLLLFLQIKKLNKSKNRVLLNSKISRLFLQIRMISKPRKRNLQKSKRRIWLKIQALKNNNLEKITKLSILPIQRILIVLINKERLRVPLIISI
jgi:hypothetical protein